MKSFVLLFVLIFFLKNCDCKKINKYCERFDMLRHQITIIDRRFFAERLPCVGEEAFCSFVRNTYTEPNKHDAPQFNKEAGINIYKTKVYMIVLKNKKRELTCGDYQSYCDYLDFDLP